MSVSYQPIDRFLTLLLVDVESDAQVLGAQDQVAQIFHKILVKEAYAVIILAKRVLAAKIRIILMDHLCLKKKKVMMGNMMSNIEMKVMVGMEVKDMHQKETTDMEKKEIMKAIKVLELGMTQMLMEIMKIQQGMEIHMIQLELVHLVDVWMVQVLQIDHVALVNAIQIAMVQVDMEVMIMEMGTEVVQETGVMAMEALVVLETLLVMEALVILGDLVAMEAMGGQVIVSPQL